jgi:hydrogenase-4 component A
VNKFVIADPEKCIGCYTCAAGCVNVHEKAGLVAYPRLTITHTNEGTMPVQCRNCDDAPCEKVCPVKAITFEEDSIQLSESLCIGCKMCSLACPFGVITPCGTIPDGEGMMSDGAYALPVETIPDEASLHPILAWTIGQRTVAVKCDLCHFLPEGPECIRVCPTKAMYMVNGPTVTETNAEKRARSVAQTIAGDILDHHTRG